MNDAGLALRRAEDHAETWQQLIAPYGGPGGLDALVAALDGPGPRARRAWAAPGLGVRRALTWEPADRRTPRWWPQGITDAHGSTGRGLLLTTWYSKEIDGANHGSRLSLLDPDSGRYEHVLLVEPRRGPDGEPTFRPLTIHAGGVAWWGPWVHVAATRRGFATCHLDDLLRVPEELREQTFGHGWVLPMRTAHRAVTADGTEPLRYSFLSLDLDDPAAPELLVGEYGRGRRTTRLTRWPLDPATRLPDPDPERCRPIEVVDGVPGMQGVVRVGGRWQVSTSHGPWGPGSVWTLTDAGWRRRRWVTPMGPEDLTVRDGSIWTVTEHPRRRWIVQLRDRPGAGA